MSAWGQEKEIKWPSRQPVWTYGSFIAAGLLFAGSMWLQYAREWSFVERFSLPMYVKTWVRGSLSATNQTRYALLDLVNKKGEQRLALDGEVEPVTRPDGTKAYAVTDAAVAQGWVKPVWNAGWFNDRKLHAFLGHWIYRDQTVWDYVKQPAYGALDLCAILFCFGLWKDGERARIRKNGQRVRGPELIPVAEFNYRNGSDGIGWVNQDQGWLDKWLKKESSKWLRIPRAVESSHLLLMGDTGAGKSAAIRQLLLQVWERGETAIIYDPAMEYLPEFYSPQRGDVILNPLDARCPYWTPGDEIRHPAEAETVANSLFQEERDREMKFFIEAPRKIFAHLLNLKPTPEELTYWMAHEEEIDKRVKGTELAAMIHPQSANQRNGVLGSLNMVANAFKLLPQEQVTKRRWSALEWSKERKGWIFLTSTPEMRKQLQPLTSLWLDLLVLRLMNQARRGSVPVWFVLDELASLQRLPQLHTALTENRKSENPVVLGFQGRSQLEKRYGLDAETMLSQPATKIFLKTSEPNAAEWISKAIGDEERAYLRETKTHSQLPQTRHSISEHMDTRIKRLVMASEISGLASLHGYMKLGNLVVRMHFPYLKLKEQHEKFIEREIEPPMRSNGYEATPPKKEPVAARQMELKPAQGQQHFFE